MHCSAINVMSCHEVCYEHSWVQLSAARETQLTLTQWLQALSWSQNYHTAELHPHTLYKCQL